MVIEDFMLLFTRGVGSRGAAHLIDYFGSAEELFAASRSELIDGAGLREELAERILRREGRDAALREVEYCRRHNIRAIAATDAEYPEPLREAVDRPHVLFVRGEVAALSMRTLTVVGTREISPSGLNVCNRLIEGLSSMADDLCIVSGLAYGVDAAAHRAAISFGATTVAVVANALPDVTPAPHRTLAEDIIRGGGAIVSELHSQTRQNGNYYLARNRILAAMSMGTLVVESPASGGSLSTADMADGYHRTVMAVPGRITDVNSFGSNVLIRSGKARMVLTPADIVEDMGWSLSEKVSEDRVDIDATMEGLSPSERMTLSAFDSAVSLDWAQLLDATGLTMGELSMVVMDLEMKGLIRALPGKRYERI